MGDRPVISVTEAAAAPASPGTTWHFEAVDVRSIQRWLESGGAGELSIASDPLVSSQERYFDTGDWRLHRAGLTLCVSEDDDGFRATLSPVVPAGDGDGEPDAGVVTQPLETLEVDALGGATGPVSERLGLLVGTRPLAERAELRISTQPVTLGREGGRSRASDSAESRSRCGGSVRISRPRISTGSRSRSASRGTRPSRRSSSVYVTPLG